MAAVVARLQRLEKRPAELDGEQRYVRARTKAYLPDQHPSQSLDWLPRAGDRVTYVPRNGPPVLVSVLLIAPADDGTIDDITVRFDSGHTTITNTAYLRRLQAEGAAAPGSASPGPSLDGAVAELMRRMSRPSCLHEGPREI
eukprot:SAG11_NODE_3108_length_2682_cov_70.794038_2_plen_142_part_00